MESNRRGSLGLFSLTDRLEITLVRFRFQKETNHFQYTIDLKDPDISQALFRMQIGLLKLQDAPNVKTNESES